MPQHLATAALLAPGLLTLAASIAGTRRGPKPALALSAVRAASLAALVVALAAAGAVLALGPSSAPLLGVGGLGVQVRLDALSVTLLSLVSFVGVIVIQFSRSYLDGDPRQGEFLSKLALTLAAVQALVMAGNLLHLGVAWVATSLCLQRLLVFHPHRRRARVGGRKKMVVARLADVALLGALGILLGAYGTADIARIGALASERPADVTVAVVLLAVAAALKSAQFPTHAWLPDVIETPTPVSALLHAGIINAGGFLILRFADVMALAETAGVLLIVVGGVTAIYGSLVAATQTSVKASLAYSTIGQMGFMIFELGIGAYRIALLHLVAHSLYKAHAFLRSGSAVGARRPDRVRASGAAAASAVSFSAATAATAHLVGAPPALVALSATFALGVAVLVLRERAARPSAAGLARALGLGALVTAAFVGVEAAMGLAFGASLPPPTDTASPAALVAMGTVVIGFAAATALALAAGARHPALEAAYVHLRNGLYVSTFFDRWVGATRRPKGAAR
ncbi:MAG: proton-conducting transporter membrane subunit [Sandaracinaceae bacterium]